ncbi:MAG: ATP-binding domain-containing protein [Lachnospiraceae bacterium]|nr:ATP-binding domain-containing protein [Lachnospiraceae bacterium]
MGIPENAAFEDTIDTPAVNHIIYSDIMDQKVKLEELLLDLKAKNIQEKDIVILSPKKRSNSVVELLDGYDIKDYSGKSTGRVRFSTIQAFKGLESSTVILTDIEDYKDEKLIYVGLSRARFNLHVLETERASSARAMLFFQRRLANGR